MPLWTAHDIAKATHGDAHGGPWAVHNVDIDSRDVGPQSLFFALPGEITDGHHFINQAFTQGATAVVLSDPNALARPDLPHVRVDDPVQALVDLGQAARARCRGQIIAVTGSAGKTGVKEALRLALERYRPGFVHASIKSFNNHIGVPLTLARMPAHCHYGVLEMGMNHAGELRHLSTMAAPHVAIITTVASAHRAFFESEEAIADAKAEIFHGLTPGGTAILNADNPHCARLIAAAHRCGVDKIVRFGWQNDADVRAHSVQLLPNASTLIADVMGEKMMLKIALPGAHWVLNALAVLAAVKVVGGDLGLAGLSLAEMAGLAGRGRRVQVACATGGEALVIDESYNANPASMAAALAVLGATEPGAGGRRIAVLGDMKELGETSDAFHAALQEPIAAAKVDVLVCVGPEMNKAAPHFRSPQKTKTVADSAAARTVLEGFLRAEDVVLIKGSNSVKLGMIVDALLSRAQS